MNKERHVCAGKTVSRQCLEPLADGRETVSAQCLETLVSGEPARLPQSTCRLVVAACQRLQ